MWFESKDQNELRRKRILISKIKSGLIEYNKEIIHRIVLLILWFKVAWQLYTVVQNDNKDYDIDVAIIFDKDNLGNDIGAIKAKNIVCEALKKKCTQLKNDPEVKKETVLQFHIQMVIILILQCIEDIKNILGMRNIHMNMLDTAMGRKDPKKKQINEWFRMK